MKAAARAMAIAMAIENLAVKIFHHFFSRKGTQCPSFHYSGTQYPPKYRIPTPQLDKIKLGLPRLPVGEGRRVASDYGAKSSSPSNRVASNQ